MLFRSGGDERASAAEAALGSLVDPAQIAQLRFVLRLLDSRAGGVLLAGRPVRFTALRPTSRDAYLRAWVQHRVPLLRSAASVFRKLLSFLAYADAEAPADSTLDGADAGAEHDAAPAEQGEREAPSYLGSRGATFRRRHRLHGPFAL